MLLASSAARAVVDKYVPGLSTSPMIDQARTMSLRQVAGFANIPQETLQTVDRELRQIPESSSSRLAPSVSGAKGS